MKCDCKYIYSLVAPAQFEPPKGDKLSTKDTTAEFTLPLMCPLFRGSTAIRELYEINRNTLTLGIFAPGEESMATKELRL